MAIWFKSFANLRDHPKLFGFASIIGVNDVEALGYIHLFFGFVCSYAEDGGLKKFPDSTIEKVCKWTGESGLFIKALTDAGFIKNTPEGRIVHDWWKENGSHIQEAERKRQARAASKRVQGQSEDAGTTVLPTDRQTDRQTYIHTDLSKRDSINNALTAFVALRAAQSAYTGISYDPGERGRRGATNLICGPKPPTKEEFDHAARNFFESDAGLTTANHAAHHFFENFYSYLSAPINRGGGTKRPSHAGDGGDRGEGGGIRSGRKSSAGAGLDRHGKSVGPSLD